MIRRTDERFPPHLESMLGLWRRQRIAPGPRPFVHADSGRDHIKRGHVRARSDSHRSRLHDRPDVWKSTEGRYANLDGGHHGKRRNRSDVSGPVRPHRRDIDDRF
jgi:hypothetical protein